MRNIFTKLRLLSFIAITILAAITLVALGNNKTSSISSDSLCSGYITYSNQSAGTTTIPLPTLAEFRIMMQPSMMATEVQLFAKNANSDNETLIGRAQPLVNTAINSSEWKFVWPTVLWKKASGNDASIYLTAKIFRSGQSSSCSLSSSTLYTIPYTNATLNNLNIAVNPIEYTTNIGTSNSQELKAVPASTILGLTVDNMIKYGVFNWSTANNNIGGISNSTNNFLSNSSVIFNAGTNAGTNAVSVFYSYGGSISETKKIPINIKQLESTIKTDSNTDDDTVKNNTEDTKTETKDINIISTTSPIPTSDLTTND